MEPTKRRGLLKYLRGWELRVVRKVAAVTVHEKIRLPSVDAGALLDDFLNLCGPMQIWAFRGALLLVELGPFLFALRPSGSLLPRRFSALSAEDRLRVVQRFERERLYQVRSAWRLVKTLIFFSYYRQPAVQKRFGYDAAAKLAKARAYRASLRDAVESA